MSSSDFDDPLTFPVEPPDGHSFHSCRSSQQLLDGLAQTFHGPQRSLHEFGDPPFFLVCPHDVDIHVFLANCINNYGMDCMKWALH